MATHSINTSDDTSSIFRHTGGRPPQGMGRKTTFEEIVRVCHFFLPKTLVMAPWRRTWQLGWTMVDWYFVGWLIRYGWSVIKSGLCFFFELTPLAWPEYPSSSRIATEPFGFQSNYRSSSIATWWTRQAIIGIKTCTTTTEPSLASGVGGRAAGCSGCSGTATWGHPNPRWSNLVFHHTSSGYGAMPIHTIFRGMNIHLPAILMFTRGIGFWPIPIFLSRGLQGGWATEVSQHYTLPFLNYEAAMQSFVAAGGNETLMWSSKSRHPKFSAHAYYADMVSYFCHWVKSFTL